MKSPQSAPAIRQYADLQSDESNALTYTTPPLSHNLEVTGPITLRLFASSTTSNFDWVVRLTDVWPDGSSNWITGGQLRASLRRIDDDRSLENGAGDIVYPYYPFDTHQAVPTGQVVEYQIAVDPTSNVFKAGHRLRLDVIGTGAAMLDAADAPGAGPGVVTIYRGQDHPSSLLLPVIPGRCQDSVPLLLTTPALDPCAGSVREALDLLSLTMTDTPDPVSVGETLTYTLDVTNVNQSEAGDVTLVDLLPKNVRLRSARSDHGRCAQRTPRTLSCSLAGLGSGETATVTIAVRPTRRGTIVNTATVQASQPVDLYPANNTATTTTTVSP
jgi:uncharacterized repeat protein (TIGR01451 family)